MQFSLFSPDDNDDDSDNGGNDKHYGNEYDDFADRVPFALKLLMMMRIQTTSHWSSPHRRVKMDLSVGTGPGRVNKDLMGDLTA